MASSFLEMFRRIVTAPVSAARESSEWLRDSAKAYLTDTGGADPVTWSEMSTFIEQYLKPHALAHMGGVAGAPSADAVSISKVADTVRADRGTVVKQIRRFFESRSR